MKKFNYAFIAFVVGICVYVGITAMGYPEKPLSVGYGPGFYPLILVGLILALCLVLLLQTIFSKKVEEEQVKSMDWATLRKPALFLGIMILFTVLLKVVGLWLDIFIFLFCAMTVMELPPKKAILPATITSTVVYLIFAVLLKVPFPAGVIFGG